MNEFISMEIIIFFPVGWSRASEGMNERGGVVVGFWWG